MSDLLIDTESQGYSVSISVLTAILTAMSISQEMIQVLTDPINGLNDKYGV